MVSIDPCYGEYIPCYLMMVSSKTRNNSLLVQVSQSKNLTSFFLRFHRLGTTMSRRITSTLVVANQSFHMLPKNCSSSFSTIKSTLFKRLWVLFWHEPRTSQFLGRCAEYC